MLRHIAQLVNPAALFEVRALQVSELTGPDGVAAVDIPEPDLRHPLMPGEGVLVEVRAGALSFPDVLIARGRYQVRIEPPYIPGSEVAGIVRVAPDGCGFSPGDRVMAFPTIGGCAELTVAPAHLTFALPTELDFAQGASLILNYHTAYFALSSRGRLATGERVLVHGAAGGVGTAALQVAKGLGASVVAIVSTAEKAQVAREAGADEVLRTDQPWREQLVESGKVDLVLDPVGGDRFIDSLRCLREGGRIVVVGFAAGTIPEVKVNRLLLSNTEVVGAGWPEYTFSRPAVNQEIAGALADLVRTGVVRPVVGARFPLEQGADAMRLIEARGAVGKVVLEV
jgi:NADPH2:quinone reductase